MINGNYMILKSAMKIVSIILIINIQTCGSMINDSNESTTSTGERKFDGKYVISGRINSVRGASSICVSLAGNDTCAEVKSGDSGDFEFSGISSGIYRLEPKCSGRSFFPESLQVEITDSDLKGMRFDEKITSWTIDGEYDFNQELVSIVKDGDYFIGVGSSESDTGDDDIFLLKFTKYGYIEWKKSIRGLGDEKAVKALRFDGNHYFILFNTVSSDINTGGMNTGVILIDQAGNVIGERLFGGYYLDVGSDIIRTSDGSVLIAGSTTSFTGSQDIFLVKFDRNCGIVGYMVIENDGIDTADSLDELVDGDGFVVTGRSESSGLKSCITVTGVSADFIGGDASGVDQRKMFHQKLISEEAEYPTSMMRYSLNEYCISGWSIAENTGTIEPLLLWINRSGDIIDKRKYSLGYDSAFESLCKGEAGEIAISGYNTRKTGLKDRDAYVKVIDAAGSEKNITRCISTDNDDKAVSAFISDGDILVVAGNRYGDDGTAYFIKSLDLNAAQ